MKQENVLLVEGQDDRNVINNLLSTHGLASNFLTKDKEGINALLKSLPIELKASEVKRIGLIVDADGPAAERWQQILYVLSKTGYVTRAITADPEGTILVANGKPSVGIWLMPDNQMAGMLEDFVAMMVPDDDKLLDKARGCVESIAATDRLFSPAHHSKAVIHTWLAWQKEPGVRMGAAITRKYLGSESKVALRFIGWLQRLLAA